MLKVGAKAPDFTARLIDRKGQFRFATAVKSGKATLFNFLMMGCVPCWTQLKTDFVRLHQRYASKGLNVVAVGLGTEENIKQYLAGADLHMPTVVGDSCRQDL